MAKKRKVKKAKKVKKIKVKRVPLVVPKAESVTSLKASYTLGTAGGLVILIAGLLAILGIKIWGPEAIAVTTVNMAVGLISGIAILIATATARKKPRMSGIVILIFSLLALATPPTYGFIFGPVLSLIGAVLLLMKK